MASMLKLAASHPSTSLTEKLFRGLREARQVQIRHSGPDAGREASIAALQAVEEFLREIPPIHEEKLFDPIVAVKQGLMDVRHGRQVHIFKGLPKRGRPTPDHSELMLRINAALSMECLMRAGRSRKDAAAEISEKLHSLKYQRPNIHRKKILGTTVENWRDECKAGPTPGGDPTMYDQFLVQCELLEQIAVEKMETVAEGYLKRLKERWPSTELNDTTEVGSD